MSEYSRIEAQHDYDERRYAQTAFGLQAIREWDKSSGPPYTPDDDSDKNSNSPISAEDGDSDE